MAELDRSSDAPDTLRGPLFYVGGAALITVMAVETVAVIGRHIGWPLLGAIEIDQAAILISACAASLIATLNQAHATVHLLTDHLPQGAKAWLARVAALLSMLFFAGVSVGSIWLTLDFWDAYEESELLHIPYKPLRILLAATAICIAFVLAYFAVRRARSKS